MFRRSLVIACLLSVACGDEESAPGPAGPTTTVEFVYRGSTTRDDRVHEQFAQCASIVGPTHIHPSWRGFDLIPFNRAGSRWRLVFDDVPTASPLRVRVSDANNCDIDICGATVTGVFANGVALTQVVDTPGGCAVRQFVEPGLSFTVMEDGTVVP